MVQLQYCTKNIIKEQKTMKKIISIMLCLAMLLSVSAFALPVLDVAEKAEISVMHRKTQENYEVSEKLAEETRREREKAVKTARREASDIIENARKTADDVFDELNKIRKNAEKEQSHAVGISRQNL